MTNLSVEHASGSSQKISGKVDPELIRELSEKGLNRSQLIEDIAELSPREDGIALLDKRGWQKFVNEHALFYLMADTRGNGWQQVIFLNRGDVAYGSPNDAQLMTQTPRHAQVVRMNEKGEVTFNSGKEKIAK